MISGRHTCIASGQLYSAVFSPLAETDMLRFLLQHSATGTGGRSGFAASPRSRLSGGSTYKGGKQLYTVEDHPLRYWQTRPIDTIWAKKSDLLVDLAYYPAPSFGVESRDPTLDKIQDCISTAFMTVRKNRLTDSGSPFWKTMHNIFTRKLLSAAISGFKGGENQHNTSFLDELKPQSDDLL